jgi:hypothetical protein
MELRDELKKSEEQEANLVKIKDLLKDELRKQAGLHEEQLLGLSA